MRPRLVGVAGGTASGKSTAALLIARALGDSCLLVQHDRYYRSLPADANFDHPEALENERLAADLRALREGRSVLLPRYDFASHTRAPEQDQVHPRPIVLVEGILVLAHPEVRALLDLRVFVDAPADLRLIRRIRRDLAQRGRDVASVLDQYERTVRPMHEAFVAPSRAHADLVLDGTRPPEDLARELLARLT